jgi:hypothetical protein
MTNYKKLETKITECEITNKDHKNNKLNTFKNKIEYIENEFLLKNE